MLLSLQYVASVAIPDEPEDFIIQKKRQAFLVSKVGEPKLGELLFFFVITYVTAQRIPR